MMKNRRTPDSPIPVAIPKSLGARWAWKFSCAARGVFAGMRGQNSFCVHIPAAFIACGIAAWLEITQADWLALALCITLVFTAELLNSAIEHLARAVAREQHPEIRDALDIASGAVLAAAIGASVVGVMVLMSHVSGV
ncbi:diacylglycerol kinase family protein [Aeoliella sp. SH292]|uniref:diacylglycerol kinase family protein n=1 Tax=Aeoliella sp. SH292 TaxID=3454464 RepID=UPI003F9AFEB6